MAATKALKLEDPEGSIQLWTKIDDLVFVMVQELAPGAPNFRMFEDNRQQLRSFLTPLVG
jgi:hypothetical protein